MSKRVSPTARLRADIDELFSSDRELSSILEDVARLSVRLMMQVAVEAEVDEFLGRVRYERRDDDDRPGSRNGWQPPATVKTTMGPVELQRPKLRGTDEAFCSRLFGAGVTRTNALESLVISGWVRGLSDRDIEAALAEVLGPEAALSKSTVSRICQRIRTEFDAWKTRGLSEVRLDYLFLDGSHFKMHPGAPAEPVLAAWGIDTDGKPVFVGLAPASSESTDAWDDSLADLVARGLRAQLLGISDGAPGLCGAFDRTFRTSLRQGCLIHRARNVIAKVSKPAEHWKRIRHSNFIERTFGETRRRVKVIGRLPGESSCLSLVWAVLDRASRGWRGLTMTPKALRLLQDLRRQLVHPPTASVITSGVMSTVSGEIRSSKGLWPVRPARPAPDLDGGHRWR